MSEARNETDPAPRTSDGQPKLVMRRTFSVPVEQVYRAWTDPEVMRRWFCPGELTVPAVDAELRVGGSYMVRMEEPDGTPHVTRGTYREIVPNERLVFTWRWEGSESETLVTVELAAIDDGGTALTLTHEGFPDPETRDRHQEGWSACLPKLATL